MSVNPTTGFVCQESFHLDTNTTSCLRYDKIKRCLKEGTENNLAAFLCVGQDSISIGGGGPLNPLPANLTSSVFLCNIGSCPSEAPVKEKDGGGKKKGGDNASTNNGSPLVSDRTLSLSGFFVIALVISQIMML
ncbi:hypothetical protein BGZ95_001557 [Linnemannia exigua]|uniref:Uncharacterized protein n=1 Tax=Linnemannia exigua TaxID=604196 RepID=A0AAD4D747_9FUNG|nr:hypothetical protein BGZ95_001557 [Linnemannia exigua]